MTNELIAILATGVALFGSIGTVPHGTRFHLLG